MAELEIFKNADDNILFTGGGNVLKRPYDFGKSFGNYTSQNIYIKINVVVSTPFSSLNWDYDYDTVSRYDVPLLSLKTASNVWYTLNRWTNSSRILRYDTPRNRGGSGGGIAAISNYPNGYIMTGFIHTATEMKLIADKRIAIVGSNTDNPTISNVFVLADNRQEGLSAPNDFAYPYQKKARVLLFDREISTDEIRYFYNNKCGAEPISYNGVIVDLNFEKAEIFDFSAAQDGTDLRVGVRDSSGRNHHGEIMNLPAGTLQEQLDFANANLFVPFLS